MPLGPEDEGIMLLPNVRNYRGADKSLARPTSRCILFDGDNIFLMLVLLYEGKSLNNRNFIITSLEEYL